VQEVELAAAQKPRSQLVHTDAPSKAENVEPAQMVHTEEPAKAADPAEHVLHVLSFTAMTAALALPATHLEHAPTVSNAAYCPPTQGSHVKVDWSPLILL
jgi:hypothetical protein